MVRELKWEDVILPPLKIDESGIGEEDRIVGQERAMRALSLGLSIDKSGYNIFVSGEDSSARHHSVMMAIKEVENDKSQLFDALYVYNGYNPMNPISISLAKGTGRKFEEMLMHHGEKKIEKDEFLEAFPYEEVAFFLSYLPEKENFPDAYRVNLVLDRSNTQKRPTLIETHPSHDSLFGFIEENKSAHLAIRLGSYQLASGGYLILNAEELMQEKGLWTTLKRYISMSEMAKRGTSVQGELLKNVRPSPIRQLTKVILIGSDETYDELAEKDREFLRLFRISPEFDFSMERNEKNIKDTVWYLRKNSKNLLPLSDDAISEILRYSSWFAEDRDMLTSQLSFLGDLELEADMTARKKKKSSIDKEDVRDAIKERSYISSLTEEQINREIKRGDLIVSLSGKKTGIANGLAVIDRGLSSFGSPAVISATCAPGNEGLVNIEHEAGLSGGIHDKGLLILEGYLRHRYAKTFPLSLYAGICFEQSYAEVDGDSASGAELFALLSAIGSIPIRQDIAITGSVNQMGHIQPVGGINEKIEGFYKACLSTTLTGEQGVVIPEKNIQSLILPYEIEDAIKRGVFHIWAIESVDDGMELLSGMESGERNAKGQFPPNTINRMIEDGLRKLYSHANKS